VNLLDDFLIRAALAGIGTALVAGPLGCFVVWRRMAYFGDATAHAALLGVALAFIFSLPIFAGVLIVALAMAVITSLAVSGRFAADTILGVLSHGALALGLIALTLVEGVQVDLMGYLFGDILAVDKVDLALIWGGGVLTLGLLFWRWQAMLNATLNPELAAAEGGKPDSERLILTLMLALLVAIAIKIVGALLITALLVIPAAAARPLARGPEAMAIGAAVVGVTATIIGLGGSYQFDTPAGPSIVAAAVFGFAVTNLISLVWSKRRNMH
jgi:zinc transport system permease protein